jgi:hypothetical protein
VAAGDDQALGGAQRADLLAIGDRGGDGLLDIDRLAGRQRHQRMLGVEGRGRGDGHHVDGVQELGHLVKRAPTQRHGHLGGAVRMRVQHRRQHHARQPRVLACVIAAEHARADHAAPQRLSHANSEMGSAGYQVSALDATRAAGLNRCLNGPQRPPGRLQEQTP